MAATSEYRRIARRKWNKAQALCQIAALPFTLMIAHHPAMAQQAEEPVQSESASRDIHHNIEDADLRAWHDLVYDQKPPAPVPDVDYGMDAETGKFIHPKATPLVRQTPGFKGQLGHWDEKSYAKNVTEMAFYPYVIDTGHTWQNIVDFDDKRYLYVYSGSDSLAIFDITDPAAARLVGQKGAIIGPDGQQTSVDPFAENDGFGAANIQWNKSLGKYVMVQSFAIPRYGIMDEKLDEPEGVETLKHWKKLKGFKVYAMNGPLPENWELLATRTTDYQHPDAPVGQQQGSGALDIPHYWGGKYMFLSAAGSDAFMLTEFPDYIYSPGFQVWDMSDPANPVFMKQFAAPGQLLGNAEHEEAYLMNPRAGNRTSWFGSRMAPFMTKSPEQGGTIAFGAMAGLGLYSLDVSDPADMKIIGHVTTAPRFAGTEFDNADVSQYERTGYIFTNGYPMNDECYEPYKDIFVIDAKDPADMHVVAKFPRPVPPQEAKFTDFCQRRGSFGPKRPGYISQPGVSRNGIIPYAFYNAGVQFFDVADPTNPKIAGYFVPRFPEKGVIPEYMFGNMSYGIFVEYDRNIVWVFSSNGFYALSTPLLGDPKTGVPEKSWPPRE